MAKIAIITGASQGIGRGIALHLARAGYDIGFSYCSAQEQAESHPRPRPDAGVSGDEGRARARLRHG